MDETNKRNWEMILNKFTDDLWIEILLRLPVKSLLGFKSVSKSWFSIISTHRFAISHLQTAPKDDEIFIVHHGIGDTEEDDSFSLFHLDSLCILENLKFPYSQGEYPFDLITSVLVGSDCGIVCVSINLNKCSAAKKKYYIYLWNPATRHSKLLPPCTDDDRIITDILGFGFDHIDSDFKVVRLVSCASSFFAEVYSSNRNAWRKVESKPIHLLYNYMFDVCHHGFLFAIEKNKSMVAFNLNKEVFVYDIQLPVTPFGEATCYIETRVSVFKETIAVIISNMDDGRIQLWTLDDEACLCGVGGVNALWTKVLTIDVDVALNFVEGLFNSVQLSLIDLGGYHFWYDLNKKVIKEFPDSLYLETCEIFKYKKSLISLEGFKQIKWAPSSSMLPNA